METRATATYDWAGARGEKWCAHLDAMEAMLAPVDEPLGEALALAGPVRIADIGCGGGGTTLALARRAPHGSVLHGYDIAPSLVEIARSRVPSELASSVSFAMADAATMPPPANRYDRLVSRFGVMFFDDAPQAFARLAQWLVPGGRLALAVWGRLVDNPWLSVVRDVVAEIVPFPSPIADAPGPLRYADPGTLETLLERAGLIEIEVQTWRAELPVGGGLPVAEAASFALASYATFSEALAGAGADAGRHAHQELVTRLHPHERGGAVWMASSVRVVTAARPR